MYVSDFNTISKKFKSEQAGALVVSCQEWHEVGSLPQQIVKSDARHFMLAMQDVSGAVDDIEHVVDALVLLKLNTMQENQVIYTVD